MALRQALKALSSLPLFSRHVAASSLSAAACSAAREASLCVAQPWTAPSGMSQIAMTRRKRMADLSCSEGRAPLRPFGDADNAKLGLDGRGLRGDGLSRESATRFGTKTPA